MVTDTFTAYSLDGSSVEGWDRLAMRAHTRNLGWQHIASELVDNALANTKDGEPCVCTLEWNTKGGNKWFAVTDNGRGASDGSVFLRPGLSGGNHSDLGNSTFGTGLFAIEVHLWGRMEIATDPRDGMIYLLQRRIFQTQHGEGQAFHASEDISKRLSIPIGGGTRVRFDRYDKRGPAKSGVARIVSHLARCYASALISGKLSLTVIFNGATERLQPEDRPKVEELKTERITISGHEFALEWGVTTEPHADGGCRLVYGGKWFDTTSEPCGDYSLGRFYASIRIPQSAGQDSMDLLKRTIEREFMDDLYDTCSTLFAPELQRADVLAQDDQNRELNSTISRLLSRPKQRQKGSGDGTKDIRAFNGRDPCGEGVEPKHTGRKRVGSRGGRKKRHDGADAPPDEFTIDWLFLGDDEPLVRFDNATARITYNKSVALLCKWHEENREVALSQVAAAFIADTVAPIDAKKRNQKVLGFMKDAAFADIYRDLIERLASNTE